MAEAKVDHLTDMLADGWSVVGYSTALTAVDGMVHSILLRRGDRLKAVSIIRTGTKEIGRTVEVLAPMPPQTSSEWP